MTMQTEDRSLRPWDAADEYLLQQKQSTFPAAGRILTINDSSGALNTALGEASVLSWNDSFCSRRAVIENARDGSLPVFTDTVSEEPLEPDLIIMKIPQSLALFRYQLAQLRKRVPEGTPLLAGAHARHLPRSFFDSFEEMTEEAEYSLIWKKARFYAGKTKSTALTETSFLEQIPYNDLVLQTLPGVFSHGKLDRGTRFFLENFPRSESPQTIADPGCGSGILALAAARAWPEASVIATDDSFPAVASTRLSAEQNGLSDRIKAFHTDVLEGVEKASVDLVLCNPPFHQQQRVSVETGMRFIRDSARVLVPGGQLFLVANKHLGYTQQLKQTFGNTIVIAQNKQFRVYMCRKQE